MPDFVQLWVYLASTPLFGLTATLATYVAAQAFYDRLDRAPWANPVLWSVVGIGCVLLATGTPYPTYFAGAQFVHVMLPEAQFCAARPPERRAADLDANGCNATVSRPTNKPGSRQVPAISRHWCDLS